MIGTQKIHLSTHPFREKNEGQQVKMTLNLFINIPPPPTFFSTDMKQKTWITNNSEYTSYALYNKVFFCYVYSFIYFSYNL